jgi:hypothetical protein
MVVVSLDAIEGIRSISTEDPSFLLIYQTNLMSVKAVHLV